MNPVNGNSRSNISIALSITFVMNEVIKTAMLNNNKSISSVQTVSVNVLLKKLMVIYLLFGQYLYQTRKDNLLIFFRIFEGRHEYFVVFIAFSKKKLYIVLLTS